MLPLNKLQSISTQNAPRYIREKNYVKTAGKTLLYPVVKLIVFGSGGGGGEQTIDDSIEADAAAKQSQEEAASRPKNDRDKAKKLLLCFVGLQVSYLTWGVLQEKIMTRQVRLRIIYFFVDFCRVSREIGFLWIFPKYFDLR